MKHNDFRNCVVTVATLIAEESSKFTGAMAIF